MAGGAGSPTGRPPPIPHGNRRPLLSRTRPGLRELCVLISLYVGYSFTRLAASDDVGNAMRHASQILHVERLTHLDVERWANQLFFENELLGLGSSFYYATAHYLVTPLVLAWLWACSREHYSAARTALVAATLVSLAGFLALPTAPPRMWAGFHDLLAQTSSVGWWGVDGSAPQGLGGLTNELAAMPSMHVGWALWCALTLSFWASNRWARGCGWAHFALTTVAVIGTGNHWLLDVVAGSVIVSLSWVVAVTGRAPQTLGAAAPPEVSAGLRRVRSTSSAGRARIGMRRP